MALCSKRRSNTPDKSHGVILSYLLTGDPPDVPPIAQPKILQGKTLSSQKGMNANLPYLGAGDIVSRSKPFQEGEYDEDIKSSSTKEQGTRSHEEENIKLLRVKETGELSSAQKEAKTEDSNSTNTWRIFSTHLEFHTKKNQLKRSSYEEDIEDTTWKIFNGPDGDIRLLIKSFRPNQDEPRNKSNFIGFPPHYENAANWIQGQIHFGSRVMNFTNRVNQDFPDLDVRALIGGLRPNQEDLSYETTWYGFLTQLGSSTNLNHTKKKFGLKVIQLLNQWILCLPYMEAFILGVISYQRLLTFVKLKKTSRRSRSHGYIKFISRYKAFSSSQVWPSIQVPNS